jgi:ferredoxin
MQVHRALRGASAESCAEKPRTRDDISEFDAVVAQTDSVKLHLFERHNTGGGAKIPLPIRRATFQEVHLGLPDAAEARACLSCGVCNECDLCQTYCPEGALKRVGHSYVFDYSVCKGCGICVTECPRNIIFMTHL